MKTNSTNPLARLTGIAVALSLFAAMGGLANAQEKGAGAKQLLRLSDRSLTPKTELATSKAMACGMCKDEYVSRVDWTARGAKKPTVTTARHLCTTCSNESTITGHGRAKAEVVTHKCPGCGA